MVEKETKKNFHGASEPGAPVRRPVRQRQGRAFGGFFGGRNWASPVGGTAWGGSASNHIYRRRCCFKWHRKLLDTSNYRFPPVRRHPRPLLAFTKEFNERTKNDAGLIIPVVITVYADRSFTFITKTPPAAVLIKKACNIESGSGVPNKTKVATISKEDVRKIAETKMPDLNAASVEAAMSMIAGTARSMGVVVGE